MCIKQKTTESQEIPVRCYHCGRIIYENIKTGHTGCRNTKCRGYLWGSKNLSEDILRKVVR